MPGPFKVTTFFQTSTGLGAGWTETFYTATGASPADAVTQVFNNYIPFRSQILHPDYQIQMVRAVDVTIPQNSRYLAISAATSAGSYPGKQGDQNSEAPFDGVLISVQTNDQRRRGFILRGIPKEVIDDTYSYVGDSNAVWAPRFRAYRNQIVAVGGAPPLGPTVCPWLLKKDVASPPQACTAMGISMGGYALTLTLVAATVPAITVNGMIKISGEKASAWVNGLWRVKAYDPVGLVVQTYPKKRQIRGTPTPIGNLCSSVATSYVTVIDTAATRGAKRDTGRPFGLLRGRRKVVLG